MPSVRVSGKFSFPTSGRTSPIIRGRLGILSGPCRHSNLELWILGLKSRWQFSNSVMMMKPMLDFHLSVKWARPWATDHG